MINIKNIGRLGNLWLTYYSSCLILKKLNLLHQFFNDIKIDYTYPFNEPDGFKKKYDNYIQDNISLFKNMEKFNMFLQNIQYKNISDDFHWQWHGKNRCGFNLRNEFFDDFIYDEKFRTLFENLLIYNEQKQYNTFFNLFPGEDYIVNNLDFFYDEDLINLLFFNSVEYNKIFNNDAVLKKYYGKIPIIGLSIRHGDKNSNIDINVINNEINDLNNKYFSDYILYVFSDDISFSKMLLNDVNTKNIYFYDKKYSEPDCINFMTLTYCNDIILWKSMSSFILAAGLQNKAIQSKLKNDTI